MKNQLPVLKEKPLIENSTGNAPKSTRHIALEILSRVEYGRYAEGLLAEAFASSLPKKIDRTFLQKMVYGTIRRQGTLDAVIAAFSDISLEKYETRVMLALRLGTYQLLFMSRVPQSAAVNETVKIASHKKHTRNFCNAVLRAVSRSLTFETKETDETRSIETAPGRIALFDRAVFPPPDDSARHIAAKYSHPEPLVERWIRRFGTEETIALCTANNRIPPIFARCNSLKISPDVFIRRVSEEIAESRIVENDMITAKGGLLLSSTLLKNGEMIIQDRTAARAAPLLNPGPGENVLDLCAAPGMKMAHIAELMSNSGRLVALDSSLRRIRLLEENRRRLGITCAELVHIDGREYAKNHAGEFDKILLDVPCSNTGVLSRRVEARWRFSEDGLKNILALQDSLLEAAALALKPGGAMVYSTCSVEAQENEEKIDGFLKSHTEFSLEESCNFFPHRGDGDGGYLARLKKAFSA